MYLLLSELRSNYEGESRIYVCALAKPLVSPSCLPHFPTLLLIVSSPAGSTSLVSTRKCTIRARAQRRKSVKCIYYTLFLWRLHIFMIWNARILLLSYWIVWNTLLKPNGSISSCENRCFLLFLLEGSEADIGCQAQDYCRSLDSVLLGKRGEIRHINCHVFVFPLLQSWKYCFIKLEGIYNVDIYHLLSYNDGCRRTVTSSY